MAFDRPTLPQLLDRVRADLVGRARGGSAFLRRSFEAAAARALAGVSHGLHGHVAWAAKQAVPTTSDDDLLLAWAGMFGIDRKQPTKSTATATFSGTNGTDLEAGTVMQRSDEVRYVVLTTATVTGGSVTVDVEAESTGIDGNTDGPVAVRLVAPVAGIVSEGTLDGAAVGGTDLEELEDLRARLLQRLREPPVGGSEADYERMVLATPGVSVDRVWVYPGRYGSSSVGVAFTVQGDAPVPTLGQRGLVLDYVDPLRPIDLLTFAVVELIAEPLTYQISLSPNTSEVRAAVIAQLRELHAREAEPGGGLLLSHIHEAISTAIGEADHELTVPASAPTASAANRLLTFDPDAVTFADL